MKSEKRVKRVRRIRVENGLNKDMQAKLVILFVMVLLAFAGLGVRLITITRDNGERYKKQVLSQQKYNSITLPYKRGDILDCKGNKLATSEKVYNMIKEGGLYDEANYYEPYYDVTDGTNWSLWMSFEKTNLSTGGYMAGPNHHDALREILKYLNEIANPEK